MKLDMLSDDPLNNSTGYLIPEFVLIAYSSLEDVPAAQLKMLVFS